MSISNNNWVSYIYKYKTPIFFSALFNVGYSIFTLVSIPLIIPFFQLLFGKSSSITDSSSKLEVLMHNFFGGLIESEGQEGALLKVCIAFVIVIFIRNIFRYLSLYVMAPVRNGIVADLREKIHNKIFNLPISYFSEERKGDLLSKSISDVQEVEWSILNVIEAIFRSPILLIGSLGFMIYLSPWMTTMVIVLIVFTVIVLGFTGKNLRAISRNAQEGLGRLTSIIEESINGVKIIKSYNAEKEHSSRFGKENLAYKKEVIKAFRVKDLASPLSESLGMAIVGILMYFGAKEVFDSQLSPESFFAFLLAFYQAIEPAKALSNSYFNIQKGMAAVDRIQHVLDTENDIQDPASNSNWDQFTDSIEFINVDFAYKGSESLSLDKVSFKINKGEKVAIIGPSGSGKTTIANLLCRFFNVTNGTINIDGFAIEEIPMADLRGQIGLVTQDAILFNESILFNLTLGKADITTDKVISALKSANALEFIEPLHNGINHVVGDNGIRLSGGQKQRLSIARAILHDAQILIFDEATSALDTASERIVQSAIDELTKGRTSLIIAHRLSTIINADKIILLEAGKILEIGTHNSLIKHNKLYQSLIKNQFA